MDYDKIEGSRWRNQGFYRTGLWRAEVLRNDDPEKRGRLQVRILHLHPESQKEGTRGDARRPVGAGGEITDPNDLGIPADVCPWAEAAFPWGAKTPGSGESASGFVCLPEVRSTVWVAFEMGHTGVPIWLGSWMGPDDMPSEYLDPDTRFMRTPSGHLLMFNDQDGSEHILLATLTGNDRVRYLRLDEDAAEVILQCGPDDTGGRIFMDESQVLVTQGNKTTGSRVTMTDAQTKIEVGTSNVIIIDATGNIQITNSGTTTVLSSGAISITAPAATLVSPGLVDLQAAGVLLGTGAVSGVCIETLITKINALWDLYKAHTHPTAAVGPPSVPSNVAAIDPAKPVIGTDSSATVKAKL
jgi:hypothetical protein